MSKVILWRGGQEIIFIVYSYSLFRCSRFIIIIIGAHGLTEKEFLIDLLDS